MATPLDDCMRDVAAEPLPLPAGEPTSVDNECTSERPEKRRRVESAESAPESSLHESCTVSAASTAPTSSPNSGGEGSEQSSIDVSEEPTQAAAAASADSSQAPAAAASISQDEVAITTPVSAAVTVVKRTFACRICGHGLSSASNRVRHERAKHPTEPSAGASAAATPAAATAVHVQPRFSSSPPNTQPQWTGFKRSRMSILTNRLYAPSPRAASAAAAAYASSAEPPSTPVSDEESDQELENFLTSASSASSASSSDGSLADASRQPLDEARPSQSAADASVPDHAVEGMCWLLSDEDMQRGCMPFLEWLTMPPLTPCEALAKRHKIKSLAHLQPVKNNLRFLFGLLHEVHLLPNKVDLRVVTRLDVCETLHRALIDRRVGASRLHALSLLLKKLLVFLSSAESREKRQYIPPSYYESFMFVDNICSDSSQRRKQDQRNRAVLGIQASQQLLRARQDAAGASRYSASSFAVPATWSSPPPSRSSEDSAAEAAVISALAGAASAKQDDAPSINEMTPAELQLLTKQCLGNLNELVHASGTISAHQLAVQDRWFMALLVTAILCLGLAPRSQVLAQLRVGSSFVKADDGRYWVKLLADMNKNARPTTFTLPSELTLIADFFLCTVRPRLLADQTHDFLFFKRNGTAPRTDFTNCTALVTQHVLNRAINPHAFRSAVITLFVEAGSTPSQLDDLARIMAHSPSTAKTYYHRPSATLKAVEANDRMRSLLLQQ